MKSNPWLPLGIANPLDPTLDRCREPAPNGSGESRQAMGERPSIQERVIEEVEALYPQMPMAKAREAGAIHAQWADAPAALHGAWNARGPLDSWALP